MQVIPIINVEDFEEVKKRLKAIEPFKHLVDFVQIDISDGTFNSVVKWHNASDLLSVETSLNIEVHLMIDNLERRIEDWLIAPIKRIIFQLESVKDPHFIIKKCKEADKEVGISIGPDTPWTQLAQFYEKVDLFQILAVYPGPSGQKFVEESLEKIEHLRKNCPDAIIEVDGGINKEVAEKCKEAGADIVSAASHIFESDNIKQKIEELKCL